MLSNKKSLTKGPLFFKITLFALPIMLTGILQVLYNMADNIVVGRFSGDELALAAVGSTGSLTHLIINMLVGVSIGTGVVVSQNFGAGNKEDVRKTVHTSLVFSVIGGIVFMIIGLIVAEPALILIKTKPELLSRAHLYLSIICIGIPATSVYNFGASILRSVGDSKTPLFILALSGMLNVMLNLFFVIVCGMAVEGVAIATISSQYASAIAVVLVLMRRKDECYGFSLKEIKGNMDFRLLGRVLRCGIPAGLQSSMFSISNITLMSAVNTFETATVTANTIATNLDGLTFITISSYGQATMTFTGQNFGANKPKRVKKVLLFALIQAVAAGILIGYSEIIFSESLISLYIKADTLNKNIVLADAQTIMKIVLGTYFLCGIMEVLSGFLRGLGYSITPMIMSIAGICGLRIAWILLVFPTEKFNTLEWLYFVYPLSWFVTITMMSVAVLIASIRLVKGRENEITS